MFSQFYLFYSCTHIFVMISQKSLPQTLNDAEASQILEDSIIKYVVKCYCTVTESSNF
jgi:hypothetical protein